MDDPWALMHAVAGGYQSGLVLVHEPGPTFEHVDDLEFSDVVVPASALLRREVGFGDVRNYLAMRRLGNAEIFVDKKVSQSTGEILGVGDSGMDKVCI